MNYDEYELTRHKDMCVPCAQKTKGRSELSAAVTEYPCVPGAFLTPSLPSR